MKSLRLALMLLGAALLNASPLVYAEPPGADATMAQMAKILLKLNHYPSDAEKAALNAISQDDQVAMRERILASAISNINHQARPEDRARLQGVIKDEAATRQQQDMARIIINLNHKPSQDDKVILSQMTE